MFLDTIRVAITAHSCISLQIVLFLITITALTTVTWLLAHILPLETDHSSSSSFCCCCCLAGRCYVFFCNLTRLNLRRRGFGKKLVHLSRLLWGSWGAPGLSGVGNMIHACETWHRPLNLWEEGIICCSQWKDENGQRLSELWNMTHRTTSTKPLRGFSNPSPLLGNLKVSNNKKTNCFGYWEVVSLLLFLSKHYGSSLFHTRICCIVWLSVEVKKTFDDTVWSEYFSLFFTVYKENDSWINC